MMINFFLVAIGGALGAIGRYAITLWASRSFGLSFPWGTLTVNVVGSLAMGLLIGFLARKGGSTSVQLFLATGVLGGFTTFSAFSLDAITLWERGQMGAAFSYVSVSVIAALVALFTGLTLARLAT